MRWLPQWVERKMSAPNVETKSAILGLNDVLGSFVRLGLSDGSSPAGALNLYEQSSAVSIPVNMIAEALADIVPVLEMDGKLIHEHPALDKVRHPSPFYTGHLFQETMAKNYLVTGEAEVVALGGVDRPPVELQPLSPKVITVTQGAGGFADPIIVSGETLTGTYELNVQGGVARYFDDTGLRELKQIRNFSSRNNALLRGQSPLVSAANEVTSHIQGGKHNVSLLENGGRMSLVFHFDEDLKKPDFDALKERVIAGYGGATNAGKIIVTAGEKLKVDETGQKNIDMDFSELHSMAARSLALQYRVPLALVTTDATTFDNYKQAVLALYDYATLPVFGLLYVGIGDLVLPRYGLDPARVRYTYDPLQITALAARRLDELAARNEINIETDNELRELIAKEPIDGGDVLLKPANLIPAGTDIFFENRTPSDAVDSDAEAIRQANL